MTDTFTESPAEPTSDRLQIVAAIVLGIAATLTALAAFNAALKDGEALKNYTTSTRELSDANFFWSAGRGTESADFSLFIEYAKANTEGNSDLAAYLYGLMRPSLQEAIDWWEADDARFNPFDTDAGSPYVVEEYDEAQTYEDSASNSFAVGAAEDDNGDEFELAAVFFALTLFFGGIATLFQSRRVSIALLGVSTIVLVIGGVSLLQAF